jgi:hypothetical protein
MYLDDIFGAEQHCSRENGGALQRLLEKGETEASLHHCGTLSWSHQSNGAM